MIITDILLTLSVSTVWALSLVAIKYALSDFPICMVTGLRSLVCGLFLLPLCKEKPNFLKVFLIGTNYSLLSIMRFKGIDMGLDVSMVIILDKMSTVFSVALSIIILGERINWRVSTGILIAISGALFISNSPGAINNMSAFLIVLIGSFFWAIYNIQIKRVHQFSSPLSVVCWSTILGSIIPLIMSIMFETGQIESIKNANIKGWLGLAFTTFLSLSWGHLIWYKMLSKYPVSQVVPFSLLEPVIGMLSSVWLLNEKISLRFLIGFAITFSGILIIVFRSPHHSYRVR